MRTSIAAFVLGVWFLQQQSALPPAWSAAILLPTAGMLLASLLSSGPARTYLTVFTTKMLLFELGFFWAAGFAAYRLNDALAEQWAGRSIQVAGVVAGMPVAIERGYRFEFDVEQTSMSQARVPRQISLRWYTAPFGQPAGKTAPPVAPGERWQFNVKLQPPHANVNPHGVDFEAWMLQKNVRASGSVHKAVRPQRIASIVYRPGYLIERARFLVAQRFDRVLGERSGVLKALAIGEQSGISPRQWELFTRTGVNHLLSISGLHITMLAGLCGSLVYFGWRSSPILLRRLAARRAASLAGLLVALLYSLAAGFSIPTQRTLFMLAVVGLALWSGRRVAASNVLALALFVVVLFDPWAVLSAGFWLSFGAVAAILYAAGRPLRRAGWWREAWTTQLAVSLALIAPLLALFQQFSLIAPLANLFAVPVVSLVVVPLTLFATLIPIDHVLLMAQRILEWLVIALYWLDAWPLAVWAQGATPFWTVLAALLGVGMLLAPRGVPARWLGAVCLLPLFFYQIERPPPGAVWVTILDVGQGLAVYVRTAQHALVYDTGPRYSDEADAGVRVIAPFLRAVGQSRLDALVVSHNDLDHSGGASSLLAQVPVEVVLSSLPPMHPVAATAAHRRCERGQAWRWDGVEMEMLAPESGSYADDSIADNDRSCVLRVRSGSGSILLAGDIERDAEEELVSSQKDALPATVLIAPHHGSRTSSSEAFLDAVRPRLTIFTVGYRNRYGHPKRDIVARYIERNSALLRTDHDGAIELRFEGGRVEIISARRNQRRYWHRIHGSTFGAERAADTL